MTRAILKAIVPQHMPSTEDYLRAVYNAVDQTGNLILRDLQSTVRTWKHKPTFYVVIHKTSGEYAIIAGTDNLIYKFVDGGTKAHPIRAKRSPYLVFQGGYTAKTRVNIIGSQEGGASGDWVKKQEVQHPGTKARNFIIRIKARRQVTMRQMTEQAIAKVNRTQR